MTQRDDSVMEEHLRLNGGLLCNLSGVTVSIMDATAQRSDGTATKLWCHIEMKDVNGATIYSGYSSTESAPARIASELVNFRVMNTQALQ
jgi:hypothetical protein